MSVPAINGLAPAENRAWRRLRDDGDRARREGGMAASHCAPACTFERAQMDLAYYRQREQAERRAAAEARDPQTKAGHIELAESYRGVIEAYERLEALRPATDDAA